MHPHTYKHVRIYTRTHANTYTHAHAHAHTNLHTQTHACTHTCTHAHAHTHTYTHMHTLQTRSDIHTRKHVHTLLVQHRLLRYIATQYRTTQRRMCSPARRPSRTSSPLWQTGLGFSRVTYRASPSPSRSTQASSLQVRACACLVASKSKPKNCGNLCGGAPPPLFLMAALCNYPTCTPLKPADHLDVCPTCPCVQAP